MRIMVSLLVIGYGSEVCDGQGAAMARWNGATKGCKRLAVAPYMGVARYLVCHMLLIARNLMKDYECVS